jgi:DNA-binding NtrC family response regulator
MQTWRLQAKTKATTCLDRLQIQRSYFEVFMLHAHQDGSCRDAAEQSSATSKKILIFEPDEYLASLLHMLLVREGFSIQAITALENARGHILAKPAPDLIFITNRWLVDDRPIILQAIEDEARWQTVPIVMLMDYFNIDVVENAMSNGVNDYLMQPFQPGDLLDLIQRHTKNEQ